MRNCILIISVLCASVCWGQYSTQYNIGVYDLTTPTNYLPTVNAWKLLPGGGVCLPDSFREGSDGYILCRASDNYLYNYSLATRGWTKLTNMGTIGQQFAIVNKSGVYALGATTYCSPYGSYGVFKWNGSAWVQPNTSSCLIKINAAGDGTLVGINQNYQAFYSINGGGGWSYIPYGNGITYIATGGVNSFCAISSSTSQPNVVLVSTNGTSWMQLAGQPVSGKGAFIDGCTIQSDDNPILLAYKGWVSSYDYASGAWSSVRTSPAIYGLTSHNKATIFGLDSTGHPYHLNLYAGSISGTTTGSFNSCPDSAHPCTSGATHTAQIQVTLPHGLNGLVQQMTSSPSAGINVTSIDYSPQWDMFFGDPNDPEGLNGAQKQGQIVCNVSGASFSGGASGTTIPYRPGDMHWSEAVLGFTGNYSVDYQQAIPGGFMTKLRCEATINECRTGTIPACAPPYISTTVGEIGISEGAGATMAQSFLWAHDKCVTNGPPGAGAFGRYSMYVIQPNGFRFCSPILVYDAIAYVDACY